MLSSSRAAAAAPLNGMDENAPPAAVAGKTPARSTARRAFGDISNRKLKQPEAAVVAKTPAAAAAAAATTTKPFKAGNSNNAAAGKLEISKTTTAKTSVTKRRVDFVLPEEEIKSIVAGAAPKSKSNSSSSKYIFNVDDESEIERPAGRLRSQQRDYWEEDRCCDVSLEGAATFRQEWSDVLLHVNEQKMQAELAEQERCVKVMEATAIAFTDDEAVDPLLDVSLDFGDIALNDLQLDSDYDEDFPNIEFL